MNLNHLCLLACELKNPTMNQYLNSLENSSWLQHIKSLLDAAIFIARVRDLEYIDQEYLRFLFRQLMWKRKMFSFTVLMVGIEQLNAVHYRRFFSVHTIVLFMVFE